MENLTKLNRRRWAVQLALTAGLTLLFLAALLWVLRGVTPVRADPGTLYADGTISNDTTDCSNPAASTATTRYVATTGSDSGNDCTAQGSPCRTVQHAVEVASPGDVIKVAAGEYNDVHSCPAPPGPYSPPSGVITQVVYISKTVAIQGGYTTTNWTSPDPDANPATLDAQGQGRVLYIASDISPTIAGLRITGGDATGLRGAFSDAGGGVYFSGATAVFSNSCIFDNSAEWGGGLYVASHSTVTLLSSNVSTNTAEEGAGLYVNTYSAATLDDSTVGNNVAATGGGLNHSARPAPLGSKRMGPLGAPGYGGGAAAWVSSTLTIADSRVISNTAEGGGGGLWLNQSTATLYGSAVMSNTAGGDGGGLLVWYESAVALDGSTVTGNAANRGAGLLLGNRSVATLTNNIVADNEANNMGGGLSIRGSAMNLLHNTIVGNRAGDGSAVYVTDYAGTSSTATLTNTILASHTVGIRVTAGSTATLESTLWHGNTTDWDGAGTIQRSNDYSGSPSFEDPSAGDYHIGPASAAIDKGAETAVDTDIDGDPRPQNGGYDIGADEFAPVSPGPLYVDGATGSDTTACTNPAAPCETIGYALTQAGNGDEIRVAEGTYTETLDIAITVTLKGGYTISGALRLPRTGETVVDANGADDSVFEIDNTNVTIEGFTIQGANRTTWAGGIDIVDSTVVISETVVHNNETTDEGGGVAVAGTSKVTLIDSTISNNVAGHGGGGIIVDGSNAQAQLVNVVVEHNEADYGGGIAVRSGASAFISNTYVISNTANNNGGGVGIWAGGPVVVMANTVISDNYGYDIASGLAMWEPGGTFTGTNLLIVDNRSGSGTGGIGLVGGEVGGQLMNVTVAGNDSATGFDGAEISGQTGGFPIVNSIFWGNGTDGSNLGGSNLNVSYSDVQGGFAGTDNIDADPRFVDAANGDYRLGVGSPCTDKGTPIGAPAHDIEGTPRDAAPDMGAYEWTGFRIFLPLTLRNFGP
jgi:hypothetical protein